MVHGSFIRGSAHGKTIELKQLDLNLRKDTSFVSALYNQEQQGRLSLKESVQ
jgi:hypothetical protein